MPARKKTTKQPVVRELFMETYSQSIVTVLDVHVSLAGRIESPQSPPVNRQAVEFLRNPKP